MKPQPVPSDTQRPIGRDTNGDVIALAPYELIGHRMILQAASGRGKSYLIRKILEQSQGVMQHIILDVEDDFYTLRQHFDYVLAGGEGADCPATIENAEELARTLLKLGTSAIIQLNDLGLEGQRRFIRLFLSSLLTAPKALWHPTLIVLDEVQRYAPQSAQAESLPAVVDLSATGRKRGFGAIFATLRLSMVSKDVLGLCANRAIGGVDQALDRRVAADTLGFLPSSEESKGLMTLDKGMFWAVGPALSPVPTLCKVDETLTQHMQSGQRNVPIPPPAARLRAILAELREKTEAKSTTTSVVTNVGEKNIVANSTPELQAMISAAEARGRAAGYKAGWDACAKAAADERIAIAQRLEDFAADVRQGAPAPRDFVVPDDAFDTKALRVIEEELCPGETKRLRGASAALAKYSEKYPAPAPAARGRATPETPMQRILDALAELAAIGVPIATRTQIMFLTGYTNLQSRGFKDGLATAYRTHLIDYPGPGQVQLTIEGSRQAAPRSTPYSAKELQEHIVNLLGGATGKVLATLVQRYPEPITREELMRETGYTNLQSRGFKEAIAKLIALKFISYPAPGRVKAEPVLFPGD